MPGDFLEDDIAGMIDTEEFGTEVTYIPYSGFELTVDVIYNKEQIGINPYTGETESIPPMIFADVNDLPNLRHKSQFIISETVEDETKDVFYDVNKYVDNEGVYEISLLKEVS